MHMSRFDAAQCRAPASGRWAYLLCDGRCFVCRKDCAVCQHEVSVVGGCCGTTPQGYFHPAESSFRKNVSAARILIALVLSSGVKSVSFDQGIVICGEQLNPTGKKKLKQALLEERYDVVLKEGILQESAKADVLDVNDRCAEALTR